MLEKILKYPPIKKALRSWIDKQVDACMNRALKSLSQVHLIQIGANDGVRYDPVRKIIERFPCRALLIEPVPYIFEQLQINYARFPNVELRQTAVTDMHGASSLPFYCFLEKAHLPFDPDYTMWGSFEKTQISKFRSIVAHFDELLTCIEVPVTEINELITSAKFEQLDVLQVDAEGWDIRLINAIELSQCQPSIIRFEHLHAPKAEVYALLQKLWQHHYATYSIGLDTLAVHQSWKKYFKILELIKKIKPAWLLPPR